MILLRILETRERRRKFSANDGKGYNCAFPICGGHYPSKDQRYKVAPYLY
jgi:hypothetical protein